MSKSVHDNELQAFARIVGASRRHLVVYAFATAVSVAGMLGFGAWALKAERDKWSEMQRFVVYVDDDGQPVRVDPANALWQPRDGDFLQFAVDWVEKTRRRPNEFSIYLRDKVWVKSHVTQEVDSKLREFWAASDKDLANRTVDVEAITPVMERSATPDDPSVQVRIDWRERVRGPGVTGGPINYSVTLRVVNQNDGTLPVSDFKNNLTGMYVTYYSVTQRSKY